MENLAVKSLLARMRNPDAINAAAKIRVIAKTLTAGTTRFWDQNVTTKVASTFLLLSLVTVGLVGGVAFVRAREALKLATFRQLIVSATLKEEEIARWFEDQQRDFFLVTQFPDVQRRFRTLLAAPSAAEGKTDHQILLKYLQEITQIKPSLSEIFVIDRRNRIVVSTDQTREGQYVVLASVTYLYLQQIKPGESFNPIFYVSRTTGKPAVTLAAPLYNEAGMRQGAILAQLNLEQIDQIIRERTGLGKSGETYLIGSLVDEFTFISRESSVEQKFAGSVSSSGIDAAMQGKSDSGLYKNYAGVPVIGVYRWLSGQDLALLVEMKQDEAFAPARQLAVTIMLVGLVSVAGLAVGVRWLTQQLKISREQLERYSHQLGQKAQEADAANRSKSEFLANMSHELRTPLNAILGFTQLMTRDAAASDMQREQLKIINRSGEHLLTLINDVLEMSKIESGRIVLNEENFNLYQMLEDIQEMFQLKAQSKNLILTLERSTTVPESVKADEGRLRQVLMNLIGNAVKFTQAGYVTVRVQCLATSPEGYSVPEASLAVPLRGELSPSVNHEPPTDTLLFEIEDSGPGIAHEEQGALFEPFGQTETGRKSKQGTGLGLSISQKFVQLMGGNIQVNSVPGRGSIFAFTIQVHRADGVVESAPRSHPLVIALAPNQPQYRILIVEDQWENRQLLVHLLAPLGFALQEAGNGEEAIARWQTWKPHLIWMDMRMPVMNGYEATQRIRSLEKVVLEEEAVSLSQLSTKDWAEAFPEPSLKTSATKILALTASAFEETRSAILAAGCDDCVRKPFQREVLFEKMAEHLGVQYVYADSAAPEVSQPSTEPQSAPMADTLGDLACHPTPGMRPNLIGSHRLQPGSLTMMSAEWIEQLHQAATKVNAKQIHALIQQIPVEHTAIAQALTQWVEQLKFEEIVAIALTE